MRLSVITTTAQGFLIGDGAFVGEQAMSAATQRGNAAIEIGIQAVDDIGRQRVLVGAVEQQTVGLHDMAPHHLAAFVQQPLVRQHLVEVGPWWR